MRQYNLNSYNGLPSSNVYCMKQDALGYLWIGTDKGLVKYNGYSFLLFDISTGLQDADVWDLNEDTKGRMWLSRISYDIGYIQHDKYHNVYVKNFNKTLYPKYIRNHAGGIRFLTSYLNKTVMFLATEYNDTIVMEKLEDIRSSINLFISGTGEILKLENGMLHTCIKKNGTYLYTPKCAYNKYKEYQLLNTTLLPFPTSCQQEMHMLHTEDCSEEVYSLDKGDFLTNDYENEGHIYLIGNTGAYMFDMQMKNGVKKEYASYLSPAQLQGNSVAYMTTGNFWGTCIATTKAGMFMAFDIPYFRKVVKTDLSKFRHVGVGFNHSQYWWNKESKILAHLDSNDNAEYTRYENIENVERVIRSGEGGLEMLTNTQFYKLEQRKTLGKYMGQSYIRHINIPNPDMSGLTTIDAMPGLNVFSTIDGLYLRDTFFCIRRGIGYCSFSVRDDTLISVLLSAERYKGIFYDSFYQCIVAYGDDNILIQKGTKIYKVQKSALAAAGIPKIETMISGGYGNIFIKSYDKITAYNIFTNRSVQLFKHYRLENALVSCHKGMLIAAGKFGVLFSKVEGPLQFSRPVLYPNTKSLVYNILYDLQPVGNRIYINTDSSLFSAPLPGDDDFATLQTTEGNYKFILKYKDTSRIIHHGDTIWLDQKEKKIQLDIIKPDGTGTLKFTTTVSNKPAGTNAIDGHILHLSAMGVDRYYTLKLQAYDDAWKSPPVMLTLYYVPTLWQTVTGKRIIGVAAGVLLLSIVFLIIFYTRKIVSKSHIRKNYLLSLELKSIYAQINPHFIFNTLNTGLYFIREHKNDEAYAHISSFSDLLRSYIKSSRNKYISLAEELENIENYITLQQQRFDDAFDFTITTDDKIDQEHTLLPSLLLQPFVENAINHGLVYKETKGHLKIDFSLTGKNEITCIIDDDGIGREASRQINSANKEKSASYGNTLIEDLIKIINTDDRLRIGITYYDKEPPDTGLQVTIIIKKIA